MTSTHTHTRESWLGQAADLILGELLAPALPDGSKTPPIRGSIGWPLSPRSRALGACWSREASADGHNELFISPRIDNPATAVLTLTHELIHAWDNNASGHQGAFAQVALAVGFERPLPALHPSAKLRDRAQQIADYLGPLPHAALTAGDPSRRKQRSRMHKLACTACGWLCRAAESHIAQLPDPAACPACGHVTLSRV